MGKLSQGVNGNSCPQESKAGFNHTWHFPKPPSSSLWGYALASSSHSVPLPGEGKGGGGWGGTQRTTVEGLPHPRQASATPFPPGGLP